METAKSTCREMVVPTNCLANLRRAVDKLVRVAQRLKLVPLPELNILENTRREEHFLGVLVVEGKEIGDRNGFVQVVDVRIRLPETGGVQATGGWQLIGRLQRLEDGLESSVFESKHLSAIEDYRKAQRMECDHCRAKRNRGMTYILQSQSGETKQVGSECADHYLKDAAAQLASFQFQELLVTLLPSEESDGGTDWAFWRDTKVTKAYGTVLAMAEVISVIRDAHGFVPSRRKNPDGEPEVINKNATWRIASENLWRREMAGLAPEAPDVEEARRLLSWAAGTLPQATDEFMAMLKAAVVEGLDLGVISERKLALIAYLPVIEARARADAERVLKLRGAAAAPEGRLPVEGKIVSSKEVLTDFGPVRKLIVELDDGNRVSSSAPSALPIENAGVGARIKFKATFKRSPTDAHFSFGSRPALIPGTGSI